MSNDASAESQTALEYAQGIKWDWPTRLSLGTEPVEEGEAAGRTRSLRAERRREDRAVRRQGAQKRFNIPPPSRITLGGVDITSAVHDVRIRSGMNMRPSIDLRLRMTGLSADVIDFSAELAAWTSATDAGPSVAAEIIEARTDGDSIRISALGGAALSESSLPRARMVGLSPLEMMYVIGRAAGMRDDQIVVPDIDNIPPELFEVIIPMQGVEVRSQIAVAGTIILPRGVVSELMPTAHSNASQDLVDRFLQHGAYVLFTPVDGRAWAAEQSAFAEARLAVAWLVVESRFSLATDFGGRPRDYFREQNRSAPTLAPLSFVRGTKSGRGWIRDTTRNSRLTASPTSSLFRGIASQTATHPRTAQAFFAFHRAATSEDLVDANLALWDCIEFLVADVDVPILMPKNDLDRVRAAIKALDLTADQRERMMQKVGEANSTSPTRRLRVLFDQTGVPCTDTEWTTLNRLRKARNSGVTHGGNAPPPLAEDLRVGLSVLARALRAAAAHE